MVFIFIIGTWLAIFLLFGECSKLYRKKWNTDYPKENEKDLLSMAAFLFCCSCTLTALFVSGFLTAFFTLDSFVDYISWDYHPVLWIPFAFGAAAIPFIIGMYLCGLIFLLLGLILYLIEKIYNFIKQKILFIMYKIF